MNKPTISAIAAIGKNRELGYKGELVWHIKEDMKHFKEITQGHPVIMGRKTFESLPNGALPNRTNIIITHNADYKADGCIVAQSIEGAITEAKKHLTPRHPERSDSEAEGSSFFTENQNEIFIIGGGEIYKLAMPLTDKLYLTIIDESADADTFFPDYSNFSLIDKKDIYAKSRNISFQTYQKR